jgi:hypothetical protein
MHVEKPTASFVLSLTGGILILVVALLLAAVMMVSVQSGSSTDMSIRFVNFNSASLAAPELWSGSSALYFLIFGVGFGSLVVFGAVMMYVRPKQHVTWGVIVLVFSLGSFFSTGGLVVGLVLGMVGGVLGITWKPSRRAAPPVPVLS